MAMAYLSESVPMCEKRYWNSRICTLSRGSCEVVWSLGSKGRVCKTSQPPCDDARRTTHTAQRTLKPQMYLDWEMKM